MKRNDKGFTLVELVVTIAVASIVTAAALSVLLMGMRINKQSNEAADRQNTTRVLLSALESMATEGQLSEVVLQGNDWAVLNQNGSVLFSYKYNYDVESGYGIVYTGGSVNETTGEITGGTELMTDLLASSVELSDNSLVTFSVTTESGTYTSSAYCRQGVEGESNAADDKADKLFGELENSTGGDGNEGSGNEDTKEAFLTQRNAFLKVLASQYQLLDGSANMGLILEGGRSTGQYYSQWYVGGTYSNGWSKATPWCACYVSWCVAQINSDIKPFAHVDKFVDYFKTGKEGSQWLTSAENVNPGDLVFFDWNRDGKPQHVGVVLAVDQSSGTIYTIEGNSSGKVALRMYQVGDSRILGYGVLNWAYEKAE